MTKAICQKKCFYNNRLWTPGETLEVPSVKEIPTHFSEKKIAVPKVEADPLTFLELQRLEAKKTLESIGNKEAHKMKIGHQDDIKKSGKTDEMFD